MKANNILADEGSLIYPPPQRQCLKSSPQGDFFYPSMFRFVRCFPNYQERYFSSLRAILDLPAQRTFIFSIPYFMLSGEKVYYVNQWVNTSRMTPLPGLCTSRKILLYMTSLSLGENSPDVQRPGSGVVGLVPDPPVKVVLFFPTEHHLLFRKKIGPL